MGGECADRGGRANEDLYQLLLKIWITQVLQAVFRKEDDVEAATDRVALLRNVGADGVDWLAWEYGPQKGGDVFCRLSLLPHGVQRDDKGSPTPERGTIMNTM